MASLIAPRATKAHVDKVLILVLVVLALLGLLAFAALWNYFTRSGRRHIDSYFHRDGRPHDVENPASPGSGARVFSNPWSAFVSSLGSAFRANSANNDTTIELETPGAPPAAIGPAEHSLSRQSDVSAHLDRYFTPSGSFRAGSEDSPLLDHGLRDPTARRGRGVGAWAARQVEKLAGGSGAAGKVDVVVGRGGVKLAGMGEGTGSALLERRRRRGGKGD